MAGDALADPRNGQQLLLVANQAGDGLAQRFDGLGRAPVRANAERVVASDLHEIGGFVEDGGNGFVVQGSLRLAHAIIFSSGTSCQLPVACRQFYERLKSLRERQLFTDMSRSRLRSQPSTWPRAWKLNSWMPGR